MVGAHRQPQLFDGSVQQLVTRLVRRCYLLDLYPLQRLVGAALSFQLYFPGIDDPAADGFARLLLLFWPLVIELKGLSGYLHMHVDAIQQGTRDAHAIAGDPVEGAVAAVAAVPQVAAGTGVHRRDQLKAGGVVDLAVGPGDGDMAVFQGFAQHLQGMAIELGELVEEEHAAMGEGDLAGFWVAAAPHQGRRRGGVVGGAEGPLTPARGPEGVVVGDRVDGGALQRLLLVHRRQDAGEAGGQHRLAGAGGADIEQRMGAGGGDFKGAPGLALAVDIRHVEVRPRRGRIVRRAFVGGQLIDAVEVGTDLEEVFRRVALESADQSRLLGILLGQDQGASRVAGGEGGREDAADGAQLPGEGKLAAEFIVTQGLAGQLIGGGEYTQGDGEIESTPLLRQIRGRQVDGDAPGGKFELAVDQGPPDPVLALPHRHLRKTDDGEAGKAVGEMDLHGHQGRLDSLLGTGVEYCE